MADHITYEPFMQQLWALVGDIGTVAERGDTRYDAVYQKLSDALDAAETHGLIRYTDEEHAGEEDTPEHAFIPVRGQTGCARCGYARGHHPSRRKGQA